MKDHPFKEQESWINALVDEIINDNTVDVYVRERVLENLSVNIYGKSFKLVDMEGHPLEGQYVDRKAPRI